MGVARIVVLIVAIAAAGVAAMLMRNLVANGSKPVVQAESQVTDTVQVLVAASDLPRGTRLTPDLVRFQAWPRASVPATFVQGEAGRDKVVGGVVRSFTVAGEPIAHLKVAVVGENGFMSALLKPGMRAVSTQITSTSGAGGFILPGDHVDVILTKQVEQFNGRRNTRVAMSETVLQDITILAIDGEFKDQQETENISGKTATLELTPREAELLLQAKASGDLSLTLRSLSVDDLLGTSDRIAINDSHSGIKITRYGHTTKTVSRGN